MKKLLNTTELTTALNMAIDDLNKAVREDKSASDVASAEATAKETAKDLTRSNMLDIFATLKNCEKPMYEAIIARTYPRYKVKKNNGDVVSYEIDKTDAPIDLVAFDDFCPNGASVNKAWRWHLEDLARSFALLHGKDIDAKTSTHDIFVTYKVGKGVVEVEDKDSKVVPSYKQLTKKLQSIVDMVIFEDNGQGLNKYKVTSADVKFLETVGASHGKTVQTVKCDANKKFVGYFTEVVNRIVTGNKYDLEYAKVKAN